MAELRGVFDYPKGVDAITFQKTTISDVSQYQQEFADAMHDGIVLELLSLQDFVNRQQFAPGADLQTILCTLQLLNDSEFTLEGKKEFVGSTPFVTHKKIVIRDIAKPIINALNVMKQHDAIRLQDMGYRDPEKMMLIRVGGWMVGDVALYQGNKYIVAAINPYEKHHDTIFEKNKPLLLIDEGLQKAVAVSPYDIRGNGSL